MEGHPTTVCPLFDWSTRSRFRPSATTDGKESRKTPELFIMTSWILVGYIGNIPTVVPGGIGILNSTWNDARGCVGIKITQCTLIMFTHCYLVGPGKTVKNRFSKMKSMNSPLFRSLDLFEMTQLPCSRWYVS